MLVLSFISHLPYILTLSLHSPPSLPTSSLHSPPTIHSHFITSFSTQSSFLINPFNPCIAYIYQISLFHPNLFSYLIPLLPTQPAFLPYFFIVYPNYFRTIIISSLLTQPTFVLFFLFFHYLPNLLSYIISSFLTQPLFVSYFFYCLPKLHSYLFVPHPTTFRTLALYCL